MRKINVDQYARKLDRPFLMVNLAAIDHFLVSLYSCYGAMTWHRHLDEDELFMGYSGTGTIETSWGSVSLSFAELVKVPKGLAHRSMADMPAVLMLVQARGLQARRNGHQPVYTGKNGELEKVSVAAEASQVVDVFAPRRIATADSLSISVQVCFGSQRFHHHEGGQLIFCQHGQIVVQTDDGMAPISRGEIVVVESGEMHRIVAAEPATAVVMARMD